MLVLWRNVSPFPHWPPQAVKERWEYKGRAAVSADIAAVLTTFHRMGSFKRSSTFSACVQMDFQDTPFFQGAISCGIHDAGSGLAASMCFQYQKQLPERQRVQETEPKWLFFPPCKRVMKGTFCSQALVSVVFPGLLSWVAYRCLGQPEGLVAQAWVCFFYYYIGKALRDESQLEETALRY